MSTKRITPKELVEKIQKRYQRGEIIRAYVTQTPCFPYTINIPPPTEKAIEKEYDAITLWIQELKKGVQHFGYSLEFRDIYYKKLGVQNMPVSASFDEGAALKAIKKESTLKKCLQMYEAIKASSLHVEDLIVQKPLLLEQHLDIWPSLLSVCRYFINHPRPHKYIRELDIAKVDTKFIESHKKIVDMLLEHVLPEQHYDKSITTFFEHGFERKYGLKYDPILIRFRILDPALYINGLHDLSIPLDDFRALNIGCETVFITENKINGLSFPNFPKSIVIFGKGYGIGNLKQVRWLEQKRIFYWGDIDTHGFSILSMLRKTYSHVKTMLMNDKTLFEYKAYWEKEADSKRFMHKAKYLFDEESHLLHKLQNNDFGENVRLEQEKISMSAVKDFLDEIINAKY